MCLYSFRSLAQFQSLPETLAKDKQFATAGKDYLDAPYTAPPFTRQESILLQAFTGMPKMEAPALTGPVADRIYELRSYEGYTEKIYKNKVKMFNDGDEVGLFKRLGFNAVFYGEVLARQPHAQPDVHDILHQPHLTRRALENIRRRPPMEDPFSHARVSKQRIQDQHLPPSPNSLFRNLIQYQIRL